MSYSYKNDTKLSIVNHTWPNVIDDVMKIKLTTECRHASCCPVCALACSDLSINKSLNLTIGYIGEVCQNQNWCRVNETAQSTFELYH